MKKLLEYYNENRKKELKTQLTQSKSLNYLINKIQNEIKSLSNIQGEYIPELTPLQARVALKGLADIDQSLSLMTAVIPPDFPLVSDVQKSPFKKSSQAITAFSSGLAVLVGIFVGYLLLIPKQPPKISTELIENIRTIAEQSPNVLKNGIENYPDFRESIQLLSEQKNQLDQLSDINQMNSGMPISIVFLIVFIIAGIIALVVCQRRKKQPPPQRKTNSASPQVNQVKFIEEILDFLHDKFEDIDNQVAKQGNKVQPKPRTPKLEDHPDILNFFQNLMGEVSDDQANVQSLTNNLSQQLPDILNQNGIDVVFYQPGIEDTSKFDFVKNIDPEIREYVTLTPALIKENQVIRRGRVVKPASF